MATTFFHSRREQRAGFRPVAVRFCSKEGATLRFMRPVTPEQTVYSVETGKVHVRQLAAECGVFKKG
jgi:hypothetical protein